MSRRPTDLKFTPLIPGRPGAGAWHRVTMPAYVVSLSDQHSAQWDAVEVMGRATPKYRYNQKTRMIQLDFYLVVENALEMTTTLILQKLNSILTLTYPIYKRDVGYNGVFCQLQLGEFLDVFGYVESVTWSISGDTPWVGIPHTPTHQPTYYDVSLAFNAIGEYGAQYRNTLEYPVKGALLPGYAPPDISGAP